MTITFNGADELIRRVNNQPKAIKNEATDIINKTALRVEKKAAYLAPVDTGMLEQNIAAMPNGPLSATITSHASYSIYQEMGTRKIPPHPYMHPAVESEELFLYQKLSNLLKKGLL